MSLTVKYLDTPEGAQEAAAVTWERLQPFSDTASIATGADDVAWATTERSVWLLDGTRDILPDDPRNIGWWSAEASATADRGFVLGEAILGETPLGGGSGDPGRYFRAPPIIIIDFSARFSATGITLQFSPSTEQWCTDIIVRWYRGGVLLAEIREHPDGPEWKGGDNVDSFDRITIELRETNHPGQMAKIKQIVVGQLIVFGREEIVSAQLVNEIDHTLGTLPVDVSRLAVYAPDDLQLRPQENQRVEIYRNSRLLATHYIESSTREAAGHYILNCQSAIGAMDDGFLGGIYEKTSVLDVLDEIFGVTRYEIDQTLAAAVVTGYIPVCSRREALQQVCFSIGAIVSTHASSVIRLFPIPVDGVGEFTADSIFTGSKVDTAQRVAAVEVTGHRFKRSNVVESLLDEEEITDEDVLITFPDPHWAYNITGGTITGSGANWITVTANGLVTVTAKTYTHITSIRTKKNPDATYAERGNVVSVGDATLVNGANIQQVLDRLYSAAERRQTLIQEVVVDEQGVGDLVDSIGPWNSRIRGIITSMDSTLTQGGQTARITIAGREV